MCALYDLLKRGFGDLLYEKLWRNGREECDMKKK
jgi:hypothetical protein